MPWIKTKQDEDWYKQMPCKDSQHSPPKMQVLPPGTHTWKCPSCGKTTTITIPHVSM